jgi:hypothetical protein
MIDVTSSGGQRVQALATRIRRAVDRSEAAEPQVVEPVLARMLDAYYDARTSPDGDRWANRVSGGSWPLLERTGAMRRSRRITAGRGFLTISYEDPAEHHQGGTAHMVARKLLPSKGALARPISLAIGTVRVEWWRTALGAQ